MEDKIKKAIQDIVWMARRYADHRKTYAPDMFNEAQQILIEEFGEDIIGQDDTNVVSTFPLASN